MISINLLDASDVEIAKLPCDEIFIDGDPTEKIIKITFGEELEILMEEQLAETLFNTLSLHF